MIDVTAIQCPECDHLPLKIIHQSEEQIVAKCRNCGNDWIITVKTVVLSESEIEAGQDDAVEITDMPF